MYHRWSRRAFLGGLAGVGVTPWLLGACSGEAESTPRAEDDGAGAVSGGSFSFDLHAHPGGFFQRGLPGYGGDEGFTARIDDMVVGGMSSAFFALVADMAILERTASGIRPKRAFEAGEAWEDYRRQLAQIRELMGIAALREATDLIGVDEAREQGAVAALLAVEGGDFLEGEVERLAQVYEDGVRSIQLVHYAQNDLGDLQTELPVYRGLSSFGVEVVDGMIELGMAIDVAHASFATVEAVAARAGVPLILSHSLLRTPERSHPRHIDEDHARLIGETGGVVGMWPSGFGSDTLDEFVDHTFRMIEVIGIDHVGLGTDMDGSYMPVIASYSDYAAWVRALSRRGLTEAEVAQVAGGNARRVLEAVL